MKEVDNGLQMISHSERSFDQISGQIQELSATIEEMAAGMQEVTASVQKMEEFSINSRDNTRLAAETSVSQLNSIHLISDEAQVLTNLSGELLTVVNSFTVKS